MACFYPVSGYRGKDGTVRLESSWASGDSRLTVNCGTCDGCLLEGARQWSVRCTHEASMHENNCFATLTYDEDHLPWDGSLDIKHWQDFAKKLRHKKGKFRFFHCGEYGEKTERPHYHALLFGIHFPDQVLYSETNGFPLYTSSTLDEIWGHGECKLGSLTPQSAGYTARYSMKKVRGTRGDIFYEREVIDDQDGTVHRVHLQPPYATMSRRPGIGQSWLDKYSRDLYPRDECVIDGQKTRVPAYYDRQLEKSDPELLEKLKTLRRQKAEKHKANNTEPRLRVRETILKSKTSQLKRESL